MWGTLRNLASPPHNYLARPKGQTVPPAAFSRPRRSRFDRRFRRRDEQRQVRLPPFGHLAGRRVAQRLRKAVLSPLRDGEGRVEDAGPPQSAFVQAILSRERVEEGRNPAENDA